MIRALILCALAACTPTWQRAELATEGIALAGLACDGGETRQFLAESRWGETNPVLGSDPSSPMLWSYLAAIGAAMLAVDHGVLSRYAWGAKAGAVVAAVVAGTEIWSVEHNIGYGSSLCGLGTGGPWKPLPDGQSSAVK